MPGRDKPQLRDAQRCSATWVLNLSMPLSRQTAVDVPRAETLHLSFPFPGQPGYDLPVLLVQNEAEQRPFIYYSGSFVEDNLTISSLKVYSAIRNGGARFHQVWVSADFQNNHTNISCGKNGSIPQDLNLFAVGLKTPLINTQASLYLHFPWKSFKLKHLSQFSGGTRREGFAYL